MDYRDKLILNIGSNFNHLTYADIEGIADLVVHLKRSDEQGCKDEPERIIVYKENGEIDHATMSEVNRELQEDEDKQWPKHVRDKIEKAEHEHNTKKRVLRGKYS